MKELKPQKPQEKFLKSSADIVIFGGAAGGGKTFTLLLEPLRYKDVEGFNGVIFRKNYTQVAAAGGLFVRLVILILTVGLQNLSNGG